MSSFRVAVVQAAAAGFDLERGLDKVARLAAEASACSRGHRGAATRPAITSAGPATSGTQGEAPNYPIVGDADFVVSKLYGMLPAETSGEAKSRTPADNQTVRNVFVIDPDKKIKLILVYPMSTGRNFDEVLRVLDSLQLTANHKVSTPVNWRRGEDVIIAGSVSDAWWISSNPMISASSIVLAERSPVCKHELCRFGGKAVVMSGTAASDEHQRCCRRPPDCRIRPWIWKPSPGSQDVPRGGT